MEFGKITQIIIDFCISFLFIFLVILSIAYLIKYGYPYFIKFLTKKWYPYKRRKYEKFLEKAKNFPPEMRIEYHDTIQNTMRKIDRLTLLEDKNREEIKKGIITREEVDLTDLIKQHIDEMITFEIENYLRPFIVVNEKYDILKLDDGIKEISTKVREEINPDLFNTHLLYTNEYFMQYIVNKTFNLLVNIVTEYNKKVEIGI